MDGLALKTEKLFDSVSKLDCLKPYVLAGGTALSLQLNHRQSEDLDFMKWRTTKSEKMEVDWYNIEKQLSSIGNVQKRDLLDIDHVEFYVSDVKFSFCACDKYSPVTCPIDFHNNIKLADMMSIMAMKMETMLRRSVFRDYYDIYSMLRSGLDIHESISNAVKYSGYKLKTKNLLAILSNESRFVPDSGFKGLSPIYNVTSHDIAQYIKEQLSGVRDIRIFERNNSFFVNAEIRGEAQLSVPITRTDYQLFKENKIDALSLVEKYYAEELNASNEMKYGFKR